MALKHFWYSLKNEEGVPIIGQPVYIYKHGTTDELDIFNSAEVSASQPLTTSSVEPSGVFEFYVKDIYSSGYSASQKMTINWGLGSIDNLDIFDKIYPVDETDSIDTDKNKLISNNFAYNMYYLHTNIDVDDALLTVHDIEPVDKEDPSNADYNKVVNDAFLNELYTSLVSAGTITISSSGAVAITFSIDKKGGTIPAWLDSLVPSAGEYYIDLNHGLDNKYPLLTMWKTPSKLVVNASKIEALTTNSIRIWTNEDWWNEIIIVG